MSSKENRTGSGYSAGSEGEGRDAVIVAAVRTAVGKAKRGAFAHTRAEDLGRAVLRAAIERTPGLNLQHIEDVIIGCAMPEGEQGLNFARTMALYAGLPASVSAVTVNRFCASGLQAIAYAAQRIRLGEADVILAGGVESMSHVPMAGFKLSPHPELAVSMPEIYMSMGHTAEEVAARYEVTREAQDEFAAASHRKAAIAIAAGRFSDEIVPVEVKREWVDETGRPRVARVICDADEGVRPDTRAEKLAALKPVFARGGTVTAGNASQMSDGAAAVMVMSRDYAEQHGYKPLGCFRAYSIAGVAPELMGIGPVEAIPRALARLALTVDQMDRIELNEAFAAQCLAIIRQLGLPEDRVNVNGGAIALGHPLGCSGAKLAVSLLHELRRCKGRYGMVSMCVGGGMGAAGIFEAEF